MVSKVTLTKILCSHKNTLQDSVQGRSHTGAQWIRFPYWFDPISPNDILLMYMVSPWPGGRSEPPATSINHQVKPNFFQIVFLKDLFSPRLRGSLIWLSPRPVQSFPFVFSLQKWSISFLGSALRVLRTRSVFGNEQR